MDPSGIQLFILFEKHPMVGLLPLLDCPSEKPCYDSMVTLLSELPWSSKLSWVALRQMCTYLDMFSSSLCDVLASIIVTGD